MSLPTDPQANPWQPHPLLAPDGAPFPCVLASLRAAAQGWEPEARLLANIRSGDIARALDEVQAILEEPKPLPTLPASGEWLADLAGHDLRHLGETLEQIVQQGFDDPTIVLKVGQAGRLLIRLAQAVEREQIQASMPERAPAAVKHRV